jgi:hypothetical protein
VSSSAAGVPRGEGRKENNMTTKQVSKWSQPQPVTVMDVAFGPRDIHQFLPAMSEIPDEFKRDQNPYVRLTSRWFFAGLERSKLRAKSGINERQALGHLQAVLGSFDPPHEQKEAGVAYLMSLWFDIA